LNLVSLSEIIFWVLFKKSGLIFKSPVATLPPTPQLAYAMWSIRMLCNAIILSVLIGDHMMHPNTSVSSVNEHC